MSATDSIPMMTTGGPVQNLAPGRISQAKQEPAGASPAFAGVLDDAMARPGPGDGAKAGRQESAGGGKDMPPEDQKQADGTDRTPAGRDTQRPLTTPGPDDFEQPPESIPPAIAEAAPDAPLPETTGAERDKLHPETPVMEGTGSVDAAAVPTGIAAGAATGGPDTAPAVAGAPGRPADIPQPPASSATTPPPVQAAPSRPEPPVGQALQPTVDSPGLSTSAAPPPPDRSIDVTVMMALWRRGAARRADAPASGARIDHALAAVTAAGPSGHLHAASSSGQPTLAVDTPFTSADWQQAMGERIQWLVGQRLQGAEIRLNPAHLGPMEVKVHVHNDQASIQFLSSHQVVRDALEAALPRLREMLGGEGVELLNVDISDRSMAGRQEHSGDGPRQAAGVLSRQHADEDPAHDSARRWTTPLIGTHRVDLFV